MCGVLHKSTDALPKVLKCIAVLIFRLNEAATQFQPCSSTNSSLEKNEKGYVCIGQLRPLAHKLSGIPQPIRANNVPVVVAPDEQVVVVRSN